MVDIRTFDLNLIRILDALLDEGSVTGAASRLGLTQPAVSGALARLRHALGDPLFVRAQRGVVPTPRALDLALSVKRVLREAEAILQPSAFDPASAQFQVSVSASDYTQRVLLTPFLSILGRDAPGLRLAIRPLLGGSLLPLMARGSVDLALLTLEEAPEQLISRRLFDDRYVCAMRRGHPLSAGVLNLDAFCDLKHALVSPQGGGFRGRVDAALDVLGRSRHVAVSVPSFLALLDILAETDLIAAIPERLVRSAPDLEQQPLPVAVPEFTIIAAWHERTRHDPAQNWLRARLADFAGAA
ncbi:LysR family transcriptional regulator [Sphingosinicella sp. BN140058]|nr:LysR family transcriptional regulator [Sphingosinicella sp. BN140058]